MKTLILISAITAAIFKGMVPAAAQTNSDKVDPSSVERSYRTAIGLRAGETSGLTYKYFTGRRTALEGILGVWPYTFGVTVLYEKYEPAFNASGLNWYYGGGGHVAIETGRSYYWNRYEDRFRYRYRSGLGIDGVIGLEYKIRQIPFAFSLDIKPFAEVGNYGGLYMSLDPGLGIKVAF